MSKLNFVGMAMAAGLAACATVQTPEQSASLQSTVYLVGDSAAPVQTTALPDGQFAGSGTPDASPLKRLYWYLGGR